jgi:hypothetical protein
LVLTDPSKRPIGEKRKERILTFYTDYQRRRRSRNSGCENIKRKKRKTERRGERTTSEVVGIQILALPVLALTRPNSV